jgi:hypothetical protein
VEDPVDDRVQRGVDDRTGLWPARGDQRPCPVGVGVPAQRPAPVQPGVGGGRVRVGRGPDSGGFLPQLRHRGPRGQVHQPLFGAQVGGGRACDDGGLRGRQVAPSQRRLHPSELG